MNGSGPALNLTEPFNASHLFLLGGAVGLCCSHQLLAYNQVHMMTAETGEPERAQWIANLDAVAELGPAVVVAGHKQVDNDNDPKIISESQQYLRDFTRIAAEETTTAGIVARMTERYPDWENLRTLWHSARTAITRTSV